MRISDWSSDVCSSDLAIAGDEALLAAQASAGSVWIVDPVDGTANFAAGRTPFTVVVAYLLDGTTRVGWIHDPCANTTTTAAAGEGAWAHGERARGGKGRQRATLGQGGSGRVDAG